MLCTWLLCSFCLAYAHSRSFFLRVGGEGGRGSRTMNGSTCVCLALYPHGNRRGFLNCGLPEQPAGSQKVRTRCRLREEPWFMRRLRVAGRFTCVEPQDLCVFQRRGRAGGHASAGLGEAPATRLGSNGVAWPVDDLVTDRFSCSFERSLARQTVQMM